MIMKICTKCGVEKPFEAFSKYKINKDGFKSQCKSCIHKYYEENAEAIKARSRKNYYANPELQKENRKRYHKENLDTLKAYQKKYNEENTEKIKNYQKKYRKEKAETIKEYKKRWKKHKLKTEPYFRFVYNFRNMCHRFTKHPSTHTHEYIGCTYKELWEYFQKQFRDGMTKENYGKVWHTDHIIPLSHFDLNVETNKKIANNWRNLQPLLIAENLSKQDKLPDNYQSILEEIKQNI